MGSNPTEPNMKRKKAKLPYQDYYVYGPYFNKSIGRYMICLIHATSKYRTSMTHARYLMSTKEKRVLLKQEHVDHIDNNPVNDDVSNLQILSRITNNRKSSYVSMVSLRCPECKSAFDRRRGLTHLVKSKGDNTCCSRQCGSKFSSRRKKEDVSDRLSCNLIREYQQPFNKTKD